MVVGWMYLNKKKNFYFLKYFFQLWRTRSISGGWSWGLKVFWGSLSYNKFYSYKFNFVYKIWNEVGIIQSLFKTLKMNFTASMVFYPGFGIFSFNPCEDLHEENFFIKHSTTLTNLYEWGNSIFLKNSKIGLILFAIQAHFSKQANFARSAGCYGKVIKKSYNWVYIQLPSTKIYIVSSLGSATLGLSSKKNFRKLVKAGQSVYLGKSPKVRGIAMNPVDHPHGGWTNKGGHPKTPSGFLSKGVKTRKTRVWSKKKIYSSKIKKA